MDKLVKKYSELVMKEASLKNLDDSLNLLKNICSKNLSFNKVNGDGLRFYENNEFENIQSLIKNWINNSNLPKTDYFANDKIKFKKDDISRYHNLSISLYCVPKYLYLNEDNIEDDAYSFIMDTTFIIFHNAYYSFLEKFEINSIIFNHIIELFLLYSTFHNRPEDSYHFKAMCYEALKNDDLAKDYYYKCLIATPSDEPSFLPTLQDYWTFLIERKKIREALEFLLKIKNEKSIIDVDFFDKLVISTFKFLEKNQLQPA